MSNHDVYVPLNTSKNSDKYNTKSPFEKAKEQLCAIYNVIANEESIILNLRALESFSKNQSRDIHEALKGDYSEQYCERKKDIFLLPRFQSFQERIEKSKFDTLNVETEASKYRFFAPFIIKAELSPGLAFSELILSLIHIIAFISVFTNGQLTTIITIAGSGSLFLLLSIVHFWYGLSRYPSLWNTLVPNNLKGSSLDRNFSEIREICAGRHNGDRRMNSQIIQFVITLPFTFIFHFVSFLVTALYYLLKIPREEGQRKYPDPVVASIFLSNTLITYIWIAAGNSGIIFATLSIFFNQRAYNSLLFKKNLKDFCLSLLFGDFLLVQEKIKSYATEIKVTEYKLGYDLEEGIRQNPEESHVGEDKEYSPISTPPPVQSLPPLLGASTSSCSVNSLVDPGKTKSTDFSTEAQKNYLSVVNGKIFSLRSNDGRIAHDQEENQSPAEIFIDTTASQQSKEEAVDHPEIEVSASYLFGKEESLNNETLEMEQNNRKVEVKKEELKPSKKSAKNKLLGFSRRIFSSPRNKTNRGNNGDDELSIQFLNPLDVHLDIDNHPGTIEWRNTISDSIQRFKIKSYTLRKHNWVMNEMHGRSFFIQEHKKRRRKLKRKEVKEHCKAFHDKKVEFNSQISGILDDLKDLKKNHNNSKSNSDHTRLSVARSSEMKTKADVTLNISPTAEDKTTQEKYTMSDSNYQTTKSDAASTAKESLVDSSKESTISTLTQSVVTENPDDPKSSEWINRESKEADDSSSALKEAISELLKCTPWIDNINLLKETGSIEESYEVQHIASNIQNTSTRKNNPPERDSEEENIAVSDNRNRSRNAKVEEKPYWQNFVDREETAKQEYDEEPREYVSGEFIPAADLSTDRRQRSHPWRSDLQKKKLEKARESRSQSKKVALKQTKRIISMLKKKRRKSGSYEVVLEENIVRKKGEREKSREYRQDDRHEVGDKYHTGNRDSDSQPSDEFVDSPPRARTAFREYRNRKKTDAHKNGLCHEISNVDFGKECGALEGMTSACSPMIEQREDDDEDYISDVKLVSTNRVL